MYRIQDLTDLLLELLSFPCASFLEHIVSLLELLVILLELMMGHSLL